MLRQGYDDHDMQEILKRAAAMDGQAELDRQILERTAAELGISPEAVQRAEAEYRQEQAERKLREEFRQMRRSQVIQHVISFVAVNAMLHGINYFTTGFYWAIFPLLGMGVGLVSKLTSLNAAKGPEFEKEFSEWRQARGA